MSMVIYTERMVVIHVFQVRRTIKCKKRLKKKHSFSTGIRKTIVKVNYLPYSLLWPPKPLSPNRMAEEAKKQDGFGMKQNRSLPLPFYTKHDPTKYKTISLVNVPKV